MFPNPTRHYTAPGASLFTRELVTCYEMLGDQPELRALYRKMLEKFPEDSDEYHAAEEALKR